MSVKTIYRLDPLYASSGEAADPEAIVAVGKLVTAVARVITRKSAGKAGGRIVKAARGRVAKANKLTKFRRELKETAKAEKGNPDVTIRRVLGVGPVKSITRITEQGTTSTSTRKGIRTVVADDGTKLLTDYRSGKSWLKAAGAKKYQLTRKISGETGNFEKVANGKFRRNPLSNKLRSARRAGIGTAMAVGAPFLGEALAGPSAQGAQSATSNGVGSPSTAPNQPVAAAPSGYGLFQYGGLVQPGRLFDGSVSAADKKRAAEQRLSYLGYDGTDPYSIAAFQEQAGIQVDGILGEQTAAALRAQQRGNGFNSVSDWQENYENAPVA